MAIKKTINRNAFNEKIIHRYLFERFYFSNNNSLKKLLPQKYHGEKINLITPEDGKEGYRPDLMIYFKKKIHGVPLEVKWNLNSAIGDNQIKYLQDNNGILATFDKWSEPEYKGIDYITIDHEDFCDWTSNHISKLSRESMVYQAKVKEASKGNQFWVVFLRGSANKNWKRMTDLHYSNPFWAFKQDNSSIKNILDLQKNDCCLFINGVASEGQGMSDNPNLKFEYYGWGITKIVDPYYMVLDDVKATFFEKNNPPINLRRWPHFMDFKILENMVVSDYGINRFTYGKRGEFSKIFADSANIGNGAPIAISRRQWESLTASLKTQKEKLKNPK